MTRYVELGIEWQEVGQGPAYVEVAGTADAHVHYGAEPPEAESLAFHSLTLRDQTNRGGMSYPGTQKIFARASRASSAIVITDLA